MTGGYATNQSNYDSMSHYVASASTTIEYPMLENFSPRSIRIFLQKYDHYVREVQERYQQRTSTNDDAASNEPAKPVSLKFCVDASWLEGAVYLGSILKENGEKIESVNTLNDSQLRKYLSKKAETSKNNVTIPILEKIVKKGLSMDKRDECVYSRMENLFISYIILLKNNGCLWIINDSPKVAVYHVLSKIRPETLQERIRNDLKLAHYEIRKDFTKFRAHCLKLAEALAILDSSDKKSLPRSGNIVNDNDNEGPPPPSGPSRQSQPPCPHPICEKEKETWKRHHKIAKCPNCKNDAERQVLYDKLRSRRNGPADGTRSRKNFTTSTTNLVARMAQSIPIGDAAVNTSINDENA